MTTPARLADFLLSYCLPVGWLALLSGLFWIGERSHYHQLYYACLAAPTLLLVLLQPKYLALLSKIRVLQLLLVFSAYMLLSASWSGSDESWLSMAKRPLYIGLLVAAAVLMARQQPQRLAQMTAYSAWAAVLCALVSIAYYGYRGEAGRLPGYGALYNPLLSAHVFGFFCVYWLVRWHQQPSLWGWQPLVALAPLWLLLLLTGSRTPLLAIAAALLWLALLQWRQRLWLLIGAALSLILLWQMLQPEQGLLDRGLSYRPAIWLEVLRQVEGHLWFGLGLGHPQVFAVAGLEQALADTHNIELGVLFEGGLIGLALWLAIYAYALGYAWCHRQRNEVLMASALVVFGLVAGLTEGSAFFSRPKEHWFLLWIPLALLAATQPHASSRATSDL
ncbi:O-antigen ligase [Pseudomonas sp. TE3786]